MYESVQRKRCLRFLFSGTQENKTRERAKLSKIQQRETKKNLRMMLRLLDEKEND